MKIEIWTDGACSGNPGPGGWACILKTILPNGKEYIVEHSGGYRTTTNNRMELVAAINGLMSLNGSHDVTIYSDSSYLCNAFINGWLADWKRTNWKNGTLKNIDMWRSLDTLVSMQHSCKFIHVKGHSSNKMNNRCDELAVIERKKPIGSLEIDAGYEVYT